MELEEVLRHSPHSLLMLKRMLEGEACWWLWFVLSVLFYVAAASSRGLEPFWRGALLALNVGFNAALLRHWWSPAAVLALLPLLAVSPLAQQRLGRQVLGWGGWLLPLSWPATVLGLAAFGLNLLRPAKLRRIWVDQNTGTVVVLGGWLWWRGFHGGYSLGQFTFLSHNALELLPHETGHTLNNASFGSLFHFIGAADELLLGWLVPSRTWADAYAEQLAESHNPRSSAKKIVPLWKQRA